MKKVEIIERHEGLSGWYATVLVDGVKYFVGIERGKRVRIAFKPRGENIGYWWNGLVRDARGRDVWYGRVNKSNGVRGLLRFAGLLEQAPGEQA